MHTSMLKSSLQTMPCVNKPCVNHEGHHMKDSSNMQQYLENEGSESTSCLRGYQNKIQVCKYTDPGVSNIIKNKLEGYIRPFSRAQTL